MNKQHNIKTYILIGLLFCLLASCETSRVKYSGLNDLVIGTQQLVLYSNNEFYLELGAGRYEGTYSIVNDTVNLQYFDKPENWPDQLLMSKHFFQTISTDEQKGSLKIKRN